MTLDTLISLALCLALAGVLGVGAQKVLGLKLGGLLVSIFLGFVGAYLGKEAVSWFHLPEPAYLTIRGRSFPLLWSVVGALTATLIVASLASRRPKSKKK